MEDEWRCGLNIGLKAAPSKARSGLPGDNQHEHEGQIDNGSMQDAAGKSVGSRLCQFYPVIKQKDSCQEHAAQINWISAIEYGTIVVMTRSTVKPTISARVKRESISN